MRLLILIAREKQSGVGAASNGATVTQKMLAAIR